MTKEIKTQIQIFEAAILDLMATRQTESLRRPDGTLPRSLKPIVGEDGELTTHPVAAAIGIDRTLALRLRLAAKGINHIPAID